MGRGYTEYRYTDCDLPGGCSVRSAYLDYVLDDGTLLHVDQADCYCRTCDCITVGERIRTVAELEHEIDQIENEPKSKERMIAEIVSSVPERIAELRVRIDWRKKRQSPPKCLHCGSTAILPIPEDDEFLHPAHGLRMRVSGRGFMSTSEWHATYTPEGDQIVSQGS